MVLFDRALACILYELFIGEPPFFADGLYRLIDMVVHNPVRWPSEFPPLLRDFLERLLIKDPQTRLSWPALLDHEYIKDLVQGMVLGLNTLLSQSLSYRSLIALILPLIFTYFVIFST